MPSATLLYSFPAPLGRRGTTAVAVLALHVVLALALIASMTLTRPVAPTDVVEPVPPVVQDRPAEHPHPSASGDWKIDLPPVAPVKLDPEDVIAPNVPQQPLTDAGPTVVDGGGEVLSPVRALHDPSPLYPAAERRLAHEGVVVVRVKVGASGRAELVEVASSSGHSRLDAAAVAAVREWIFAPAQNAAGPIVSWVTLSVRFRLAD
jgi:protein TonB